MSDLEVCKKENLHPFPWKYWWALSMRAVDVPFLAWLGRVGTPDIPPAGSIVPSRVRVAVSITPTKLTAWLSSRAQ